MNNLSYTKLSQEQTAEWVDELYKISGFLGGNGDVCEIAARRLRTLASNIAQMTGYDEESSELTQQ